MRCAPRCRAGALLLRLGALPVGDGALVSGFGLTRERAFGFAHPLPGRPDSGVGALERRRAGADLEQAQLLLRQRGLLVGVVLLAAEQAPAQAGELAGRRNHRDLVPTPSAN